jgi:hydrogenase maturation protease
MNFTPVEKIAAALLYEGYILYPYRPTAIKNLQRWNFGTLYPRVYAQAQTPQEPFRLIAECLVLPGGDASLDLKASFLQLIRRSQREPGALHPLTDLSLAWDEAVEINSEHNGLKLASLLGSPLIVPLAVSTDLRPILSISVQTLASGASRVHIELENDTALASASEARREEALSRSMVSAHLLLGLADGQFISLLEPPGRHAADAKACDNVGVFPVLAGKEPDRSIMLVSPIILYDYPKTAPESAGDFFDGTEMDEMLMLRVLTLSDGEKKEMRAADPRARRVLERVEALTGEEMLEAHGVIREMRELREPRSNSRGSWRATS